MKTVKRTQVVYEMSAANAPVLEIDQGEKVRFLTEDAYSGILKTSRDRYPSSMANRGNPATGPVFIRGAKPNQVLAIKLHSITPTGSGTMLTGPSRGPLGYKLQADSVAKLPLRGRSILVDKRRIAMRPMVGVIGLAPAGAAIATWWPGEHGGNMDCNVIAAGATLYLPVAVDGALLALGDVHAAQGNGEVAICAVETKGEVVVSAKVLAASMVTPAVETRRDVYILASAETLDAAETIVLDKTYRYLAEIRGMGDHEAVRFLSLVCDIEICQVVDPLKTLRVRIPKRYLSK